MLDHEMHVNRDNKSKYVCANLAFNVLPPSTSKGTHHLTFLKVNMLQPSPKPKNQPSQTFYKKNNYIFCGQFYTGF